MWSYSIRLMPGSRYTGMTASTLTDALALCRLAQERAKADGRNVPAFEVRDLIGKKSVQVEAR